MSTIIIPPNYFQLLPDELIHLILLMVNDSDMENMSSVTSQFRDILTVDHFWHDRHLQYFGDEPIKLAYQDLSWRSIYHLYGCNNSYMVPLYNNNGRHLTNIRILLSENLDQIFWEIKQKLHRETLLCKVVIDQYTMILGEIWDIPIGTYIYSSVTHSALYGYLLESLSAMASVSLLKHLAIPPITETSVIYIIII